MEILFKNSKITIPGIILLLIAEVFFLEQIVDANTSKYKKIIILFIIFIMQID